MIRGFLVYGFQGYICLGYGVLESGVSASRILWVEFLAQWTPEISGFIGYLTKDTFAFYPAF